MSLLHAHLSAPRLDVSLICTSDLNKDVEFLKDVVDELQQQRRHRAMPSGGMLNEAMKDLRQEATTKDKLVTGAGSS